MRTWVAALLPLSLFVAPAVAQVYKCKDAKGNVTFQETACDANRSANQVNSKPSTSGFQMPKGESKAEPLEPPPQAGRGGAAPDAPAAQANAPAKVARTVAQAEERKFISNGMERSLVLEKLGLPDRQTVYQITYIQSQTRSTEPYIDIYDPAPGDEQTRTRIRYVGQLVESVMRDPVR